MLELKGTQSKSLFQGEILRMAGRVMEVRSDYAYDNFSNLRVTLPDGSGRSADTQFYAKVIRQVADKPVILRLHATYLPAEVQKILETGV